ncbi:MAG: GrpB family protein [Acidimicrobiia bacterium]
MPEPDELELIGGRERRPIVVVDHDPAWPQRFAVERARIAAALPDATSIEHVGSTSVPGLPAKPIVDIQVAVPGDLDAAIPPLEAAGYELRVREPEHRMLRTPARDVHVHLWADPVDTARHLLFRDWLRVSEEDRDLYAATKRELATRDWDDMNDYADAKSPIIASITARAEAWAASTGRR